jgi:hypothetical protein
MSTKRPNTVQGWRVVIATLQADARKIETAPPNRAEVVAGIESFWRGAAAAGDQRLAHYVATGALADAVTLRAGPDGLVNVAPLLAALLGPDVPAAAMIRHVPDGAGGLATAERADRLAAIAVELLVAECAEEALHEAAEARGERVHRRPDADPRAVLGVWEPPARTAVFEPVEPLTSEPRGAAVARSAYLSGGRE